MDTRTRFPQHSAPQRGSPLLADPARPSARALLRQARTVSRAIDQARATLQRGSDSITSTLYPVDDAILALSGLLGVCEIVNDMGSSRSGRLSAGLAGRLGSRAFARLTKDPVVRSRLRGFAAAQPLPLSAVEQRFLARLIDDLDRIESHESAALTDRLSRLAAISERFLANSERVTGAITLAPADVGALPPALRHELTPAEHDRWAFSLKPDDTIALLAALPVRDARAALERIYLDRGASANAPLLQEALMLRAEIAAAEGCGSWADLVTLRRSVRSAPAVMDFYAELGAAIGPLLAREEQAMSQALAVEGAPPGPVASHDVLRGIALLRAQSTFDESGFQLYFEAEHTLAALLDLMGDLLGLGFLRHETVPRDRAGVSIYDVIDHLHPEAPRGLLYVDLYARPGKTNQAQASTLAAGRAGAPERRDTAPAWSFSMAIAAPAPGDRALLRPDELRTMCHEIGHALQGMCMRSPFALFNVYDADHESEWIEAPSQTVERIASEPALLVRLGRHVETGEPLPVDLAQGASLSAGLGSASRAAHQIYMGIFDQLLHGPGPVDPAEVDAEAARIAGVLRHEGASFATSFTHLFGGYAGGYYGYLWSEIRAAEMWATMRARGIADPVTWQSWRREVLEPGFGRSPEESLRIFLGREPTLEAYLDELSRGMV